MWHCNKRRERGENRETVSSSRNGVDASNEEDRNDQNRIGEKPPVSSFINAGSIAPPAAAREMARARLLFPRSPVAAPALACCSAPFLPRDPLLWRPFSRARWSRRRARSRQSPARAPASGFPLPRSPASGLHPASLPPNPPFSKPPNPNLVFFPQLFPQLIPNL